MLTKTPGSGFETAGLFLVHPTRLNLRHLFFRIVVDAHVVSAVPAILAAKQTTTIPIVIITTVDPVAAGIVVSLARPGGRIRSRVSKASPVIQSLKLEGDNVLLQDVKRTVAAGHVHGSSVADRNFPSSCFLF
jgi:hypothetical protein